jgi:hypothetical protein
VSEWARVSPLIRLTPYPSAAVRYLISVSNFCHDFYGDPKAQALPREGGKLATWQTYVAQTLDL